MELMSIYKTNELNNAVKIYSEKDSSVMLIIFKVN